MCAYKAEKSKLEEVLGNLSRAISGKMVRDLAVSYSFAESAWATRKTGSIGKGVLVEAKAGRVLWIPGGNPIGDPSPVRLSTRKGANLLKQIQVSERLTCRQANNIPCRPPFHRSLLAILPALFQRIPTHVLNGKEGCLCCRCWSPAEPT